MQSIPHFQRPRVVAPWLFRLLALSGLAVTATLRGADAAPAPPEQIQADGPALLREWTPPVYPPERLKQRQSGMVNVRLVVDDTGRVTSARALEDSDEPFIEPALAAVKRWGFAPALEHAKPVACCLDAQVMFSPAVGQQKPSPVPPDDQINAFRPAPRSSPVPTVTPPGDYPAALLERKLAGRVRFSCTVTKDGRATAVRLLAASHPEFILPALESLTHWEFTPAMQGDLAVVAPVQGVVTFDPLSAKPAEVLALNGITAPDGTSPSASPGLIYAVDPVWPVDLLLKGEGGSASVDFTVNASGAVREARVAEATRPELGQALLAAVELSGFSPAIDHNQVVAATLRKHAEFAPVPLDGADESDPLARVVLALRRGEVGGAKGLDQKITPLYRVSPEYPVSLKASGAPKGHADIEVVIDREGRARLPRIVSATQEEFGWAAATAAAQWVFSAPTRGGAHVDVKARIPFEFAPPKD